MAYLTFFEYKSMGGAIAEESAFMRHNARAYAIITRMTHGRILNESPVRDAVKYATFDLINAINTDVLGGSDGREIASASNDGVSVSYVSGGSNAAAAIAQRYSAIVRQYLEYETDKNGTLLLYAGVDV